MKFMKPITLFATFMLAFSIHTQAQSLPDQGQLGIRANVTGQATIEIPYMLNEDFSLAPYLGLNAVQDQSTSLNIGIRPRYYLGLTNTVATYFTGTLGFANTSFSNTNSSVTDFTLGVGYGAEYFFSDKFSTSADVNLNSRFGDSATSLFTVARVSASVYF
jgi:hypothetical protein